MSAALMFEISNELTCHGNMAHANMHTVETCACQGKISKISVLKEHVRNKGDN